MSAKAVPNPWTTLYFEGKALPGIWEVRMPSLAKTPAVGTFGVFEMEVLISTPKEWRGVQRFIKRAWRSGPVNPIGVDHPALNAFRIDELLVVGISPLRRKRSTVRILFQCVEYVSQ